MGLVAFFWLSICTQLPAADGQGDAGSSPAAAPASSLDRDGKVKISGQVKGAYVDFALYGPAYAEATRYRPWNEYVDLAFTLQPAAQLESQAVFRMQNVFGAFWGEGDIFGVRRLYLKGDYPVYFTVGDYQARLTPLTLMTFDDENPFEAVFFQDKKNRNREQVYLPADQTWPLTGFQIGSRLDLDPAQHIGLRVDALGARLAVANMTASTLTYGHDQYLLGAMLNLDLTPDIALEGHSLTQFDLQETGDPAAPAFAGRIYGAGGKIYLWPKVFSLSGEWDQSLSNTHTGTTDYLQDSAIRAEVGVETEYVSLTGAYAQIGGDYVAPGAQTRLRDANVNPPLVTENNTWDISSNWFPDSGYPVTPHYPSGTPLTKYNHQILASKLKFYPFENNTFPYGPATPNRDSYQAQAVLHLWPKVLEPMLKFVQARELVDATGDGKREFRVYSAGTRFHWEFLTGSAGYQLEDTNNQNHIAFTTTTIHAGLEAVIIKELSGLLGYQHRDFNGSEFFGSDFVNYTDQIIDQYGAGLKAVLYDKLEIMGNYQLSKVMDLYDGSGSYDAHEVDVIMQYTF